MVEDELAKHYGVLRLGACEGVEEHFFAITGQKKVQHRLLGRLIAGSGKK